MLMLNVDNTDISKLVETTSIRLLILILPKMNRYVKTFKVKDGDKDKKSKLMPFLIDDDKLLEKYQAV